MLERNSNARRPMQPWHIRIHLILGVMPAVLPSVVPGHPHPALAPRSPARPHMSEPITDWSQRTNSQLLVHAQEHDGPTSRAAFGAFYLRVAPEIRGYVTRCMRRCDQKFDVEDAVQTTFLDMWTGRHSFHPELSPVDARPWYLRCAFNAMCQLLRQCRAVPAVDDASAAERVPDPEPQPDARASEREMAECALLAAATLLPEREQRILTLRIFDGLSHEEIAEQVCESSENVRKCFSRLRRRLCAAFGVGEDDGQLTPALRHARELRISVKAKPEENP